MKKNSLIFAALFAAIGFTACDEGDIIDDDETVRTAGKTVILTADLTGIATWGSQYSIVLAGFAEGSNYAVTQKRIAAVADGHVETTLDITADSLSTIELCATNRLRERVATFAVISMEASHGDTLRLDAGALDIGQFATLQQLVFTGTCARCHGLGATPAGELTLVEGKSYEQLVDHPARQPENGMRVLPGSASESLLHHVVNGTAPNIRFDHSNMIKEQATLTLIDNWINGGAQP